MSGWDMFVSRVLTKGESIGADETFDPVSYWLYLHGNGKERVTIPTSLLDGENLEEVDLEESLNRAENYE